MRGPALSPPADVDFLTARGRVWTMGVLNATPDSFYPASRLPNPAETLARAQRMLDEGADVLDIGGESTRPGAGPIPFRTEIERVIPAIEALRNRWPRAIISVDTQKAEVARQAFERGAAILNDISALRGDPEMAAVAADSDAVVVLMHMQGTPQTMQHRPFYRDVVSDLCDFFEERLAFAVRRRIPESRIILDPGFGFGKTLEHNVTLLRSLNKFRRFGRPLLVGLSRKSFIGRLAPSIAGATPSVENRLEGTLAATLWAVQQGASGVRTHDVGATRQAISVWKALRP